MNMRSLLPLFVLVAAAPLCAQSLTLRSGEIVVGRVVDIDAHNLRVDVTFPAAGTRIIARSEVAPLSIYAALAARIDPSDGKAHLELAASARKLGLFAIAIAEAREAARRDRKLGPTVKRLVPALREEIAADILRQAELDFADDRLGLARMAVGVVLRDYKKTGSAKPAAALLKKIVVRAGPAPREASAKEIEGAVKIARRALDRTAKDVKVSSHPKMKEQRRLQKAVTRLEKAWKAVGDLVPDASVLKKAAGGTAVRVADQLALAQAQLRRRLTAAYLALGEIYLQRQALPDADEWCNKACAIDPENKGSHALHRLILQAKIVNGWGY